MNHRKSRRALASSSVSLLILASTVAFSQATTGAPMQQPTMPAQQQQQTAGSVANPMDAGSASAQSLNDQDFVHKALEGGDAEVQLGQLAQQKSQSEDVKQFGRKMVQDHTALGDKVIKPMAQALGVKEPKGPSKKDKQLMASLSQLSGPQFDQEYIKAMIKDHKQDLKDFKSEAEMTQNPAMKKAAEEGENMISQHLQLIEQIAQKHNVEAER